MVGDEEYKNKKLNKLNLVNGQMDRRVDVQMAGWLIS